MAIYLNNSTCFIRMGMGKQKSSLNRGMGIFVQTIVGFETSMDIPLKHLTPPRMCIYRITFEYQKITKKT